MSVEPNDREAVATRRNPLVIGVAVIILLGALGFLLFGGRGRAPAASEAAPTRAAGPPLAVGELPPRPERPLAVGDRAPDFTLPVLDGDLVWLSRFEGRPVIVNFWASWCAPCRLEMPELQRIFDERQAEGLVILAINRGETDEAARAFFVDELGLTFTPAMDRDELITELYGVGQFMPTSFFINGEGQITAIHRGLMTEGQINGYLADTIGPG